MSIGQVKPNTVIPTNFKLPSNNINTRRNSTNVYSNRQHPYSRGTNRNGNGDRRNFGQLEYGQGNRNSGRGNSQGNSGYNPQRTFNGSSDACNNGNGGYNGGNCNLPRHQRVQSVPSQQQRDDCHYRRQCITFGLTAKMASTDVDPVWTIESGCTHHVTYNQAWFTTTTPYTGWITVGGKKQIPILANGDIFLKVIDSKGRPQMLMLRNVLYTDEIKFNLFSVPVAAKKDFRFSF